MSNWRNLGIGKVLYQCYHIVMESECGDSLLTDHETKAIMLRDQQRSHNHGACRETGAPLSLGVIRRSEIVWPYNFPGRNPTPNGLNGTADEL